MHKILFVLLILLQTPAGAQTTSGDSVAAAALFKDAKGLFLSDKTECLNKALKGLEIADRIQNKTLQGNLSNIVGIMYGYQAKYTEGLVYLNKALNISNQTNDKFLASKAYNNMGLNYMQQGNQLKAIEAGLNAVKIEEEIKDLIGLAGTYANISNSYYNLKIPVKALIYADSALKYFKLNNSETGIANIYNTKGIIYADQQQFTNALKYYSLSLAIKRKINDATGQANALTNIGSLYTDLKQYDKAKITLAAAAKLFKAENDPKGLAEVAGNMGLLKTAQNDTSALTYLKNTLNYAKKNTTIEQQRELALDISKNYELHSDYKNSLKYYQIYTGLKDSTINLDVIKHIENLQAQYQNEKKQHQIVLLNKQSVIQKLQVSKKNTTISVIGVIFIMFLIFSYLAYSRYRIKQNGHLQAAVIQQQDIASKRIIEAEEAERKRIAADLHDGVGQLFSTVKMNLETLIDRFITPTPDATLLAEKTMAMVDESCTEVRSIAHQMMPNALIKSGLVSAVRDFINMIPSDKLKISVDTKGINARLETSVETVLYRVIQESVNNVIKHANATTLDIILLCDTKEITVTIEDNGKGFDTSNQGKFKGIGLNNMTSRVEYLKGAVEVSSSPGKGTLVAIYVPLALKIINGHKKYIYS
ncbi:two-component system NarL family sensor kinase [Pedobacter sp. UYP24]